jgi:MraZ protein
VLSAFQGYWVCPGLNGTFWESGFDLKLEKRTRVEDVTETPDEHTGGDQALSNQAAGGSASSWDDVSIGFSGNPKAKLDERGRLKMPAEFKAFIEKKYGKDFNAFYITSQDGETAEIFPLPEWQQQMGKILKMPKSQPARVKLLERYNLYGDRADMDPQGRLQFPEELRSAALLTGDVKVSGEGNFLRVTSLARLRENVKANPMTAQEIDSLTEYGL